MEEKNLPIDELVKLFYYSFPKNDNNMKFHCYYKGNYENSEDCEKTDRIADKAIDEIRNKNIDYTVNVIKEEFNIIGRVKINDDKVDYVRFCVGKDGYFRFIFTYDNLYTFCLYESKELMNIVFNHYIRKESGNMMFKINRDTIGYNITEPDIIALYNLIKCNIKDENEYESFIESIDLDKQIERFKNETIFNRNDDLIYYKDNIIDYNEETEEPKYAVIIGHIKDGNQVIYKTSNSINAKFKLKEELNKILSKGNIKIDYSNNSFYLVRDENGFTEWAKVVHYPLNQNELHVIPNEI